MFPSHDPGQGRKVQITNDGDLVIPDKDRKKVITSSDLILDLPRSASFDTKHLETMIKRRGINKKKGKKIDITNEDVKRTRLIDAYLNRNFAYLSNIPTKKGDRKKGRGLKELAYDFFGRPIIGTGKLLYGPNIRRDNIRPQLMPQRVHERLLSQKPIYTDLDRS